MEEMKDKEGKYGELSPARWFEVVTPIFNQYGYGV